MDPSSSPALPSPASVSATQAAATTGANSPSISTDGLVKAYGQRNVVNGVNIRVAAGEVVGLLGPNGAGKTTTFYMVVGLVPARYS